MRRTFDHRAARRANKAGLFIVLIALLFQLVSPLATQSALAGQAESSPAAPTAEPQPTITPDPTIPAPTATTEPTAEPSATIEQTTEPTATSELTPTPEFSPTPSPTSTEESFQAAADPIVITMTPSTNPAGVGTSVTVAVSLSGTLTDTGGAPIPNGDIYFSGHYPADTPLFSTPLPAGCSAMYDSQIHGTPGRDFHILCSTDANGNFNYSFNVPFTTLNVAGTYPITGKLQATFNTGPVLVDTTTFGTLTVGLPVTGHADLDLISDDLSVALGGNVEINVSFEGDLSAQGELYLSGSWPFDIETTEADLPDACSIVDQYSGPAPYNQFDVLCETNPDGSFNFAFWMSGNAPGTAGVHGFEVSLYITDLTNQPALATTSAELTVGATWPEITITTDTPVVAPGAPVTYTVSFSGDLLDTDTVFFEGSWRFSSLPVISNYSSDTCRDEFDFQESVHTWWFVVNCGVEPTGDGHFEFSYTITGNAPVTPGFYEIGATLYDGNQDEINDKQVYAVLQVSGETSGGQGTISVTTDTPNVLPGSPITFDVTVTGNLDTGHTAYFSTSWPFTVEAEYTSSSQECSPVFDGLYNGKYALDLDCDSDPAGNFSHTFSVTGTAPMQPGVYNIQATLYAPDFHDTIIATLDPAAQLTVTGPVVEEYSIVVNPETLTVVGDTTVTFDLTVSGILADASGVPIDGAVYLESYWPFAGGLVVGDATGDCVRDLAYVGFVTMVCQTNANGAFSGTIRVSGTAPSNEGDHAINAVLTETDASGRTLLPNSRVGTLTVDNSDNVGLSILPETITVTTEQQVDYRVMVEGTIGTGAETPLQLTIEIPFEADPGDPWCDTTLSCAISSNTWEPTTETRTVVLDIVSGTGGSVDLTFHFLAVPPQEPGTYPLSAEISRSGSAEPIDSATGSITVTEPPPVESYVLNVDPVDSTVEVGAEVTYEFSLSGRLVTNGEPVGSGILNLELDLPFTLEGFVPDGQVPGCGLIHGTPERVTCPTSADGTFAHTFTMSGTAPETAGSHPMVAELRETNGSGRVLIASYTIATLTTEAAPTPTPSPTVEPTATPSPTTEPTATAEPETGSTTVTISTVDGGDIPGSAEICIGGVCTTISGIEASGFTAADLPSGTVVTLTGIADGIQPVTVTDAAPYLDFTGSVEVIAGQTITLAIVLQLDDDPTPSPTGPTGEPTPTPTEDPGGPTSTPTATPGGAPDQPIDTLPSTGASAGSRGTGPWLLLMLAFAIATTGFAGWRRQSRMSC